MAPTVDTEVLYVSQWPLFQAFFAGEPLVGAKLYTFAAATSTPKAAYHDAFFIVPHANPIVLDDNGSAVVWLNGTYNLRLFDADDTLVWAVDNFAWPDPAAPAPGGVQTGMNEATGVTPSPGSGQISVPNLVPLGYRCLGAICRIDVAFGTSQGLTQLAVGDATALDGWGLCAITAGATTTQQSFRRGDEPVASVPYVVLISALSGLFDATGSLTVRATYQAINGWS